MKNLPLREASDGETVRLNEGLKAPSGDMKIDIPSIGTGIMRSSASWIIFMLMAENCKLTQEQIIVEAMRQLGITPEDIAAQWHDKACQECGISLRSHPSKSGGCF